MYRRPAHAYCVCTTNRMDYRFGQQPRKKRASLTVACHLSLLHYGERIPFPRIPPPFWLMYRESGTKIIERTSFRPSNRPKLTPSNTVASTKTKKKINQIKPKTFPVKRKKKIRCDAWSAFSSFFRSTWSSFLAAKILFFHCRYLSSLPYVPHFNISCYAIEMIAPKNVSAFCR